MSAKPGLEQFNNPTFHLARLRLARRIEKAGLSSAVADYGMLMMTRFFRIFRRLMLAFGVTFGLSGLGNAHSGMVDGYGCHRGADKVSYHCHQGQFIGRTFKSKEDFLRQLRGGKSEQLSPKSNPPQLEKKIDK
jgi:hypothetical protein